MEKVQPYISAEQQPREFTLRAVVLGIISGIIFGAANAYLGLRVGFTISTSVPIAIIAVAVLHFLRNGSVLETNIVQSIGSASSSLSSGLIFTVPALFIWGMPPSVAQMAVWSCFGGLLGATFMILLRKPLIVEAHDTLPYPEGTACAEVIKAADAGGAGAGPVFKGIGISMALKTCLSFLKLWPAKVAVAIPALPKALFSLETSPALLGVGYILNYRVSATVVGGGILSWLVLIPALAYVGELASVPVPPVTNELIANLSPKQIWHNYIRFIGAGAVAAAGIITVLRGLPTMIQSFQHGLHALKNRHAAANAPRTDRDIPMKWIFIIVGSIIAILALVPGLLGGLSEGPGRFVAACAITFFAFIFVTVSSRIVGMVGVSTNPTSGMTIVTLLGTSMLFYALGWTDDAGKATALIVGTVVCVAASISGDISQDLKTGYLLGSTPRSQQIGELFGVLTSCTFIAGAIWMLGQTFVFGGEELPAPQATLMQTVIDGVMQANLPWALILLGVGITFFIELMGIPSLAFAVGVYLPLSALVPIYIGGIVRYCVDKRRKTQSDAADGILFSSGLIAGEGLTGILLAAYAFGFGKASGIGLSLSAPWDQLLSVSVFVALALWLYRIARK